MPQLPKQTLFDYIDNLVCPWVIDRTTLYSFSMVHRDFNDWQSFHRAWPDFYDRELYDAIDCLCPGYYKHVVYAIHPHEFFKFGNLASGDLFRVNLDLSTYGNWVDQAQKKLKFTYRPNEWNEFKSLDLNPNVCDINLTKMLDSQQGFVEEYTRICDKMNISTHVNLAMVLYQDWLSVRGKK